MVRTKSLFSTMKKLLRLDDLSAGGRDKGALFDLLGMRVVVHPRERETEGEEAEEEEGETVVSFASAGTATTSPPPLPPFPSSMSRAERDAISAC